MTYRDLIGVIAALLGRSRRRILVVAASAFLLAAIGTVLLAETESALERVRTKDTLTVITGNNSTTYYTYRGKPQGFEYDLAAAFAEYLGVELRVVTAPWSQMMPKLRDGAGDFVAAGLTVTPERERLVDFSDGYLVVRQHVIAHASNYGIRDMADLIDKKIHVRSGSSYEERLRSLRRNGLDIEIVLREDVPTEELIREVANEEIELTIADTHIAELNRRYYPDVRIAFPISGTQTIAWAVAPSQHELRSEMNEFFAMIKETGVFDRIYERYFANVRVFDYVDLKTFHERLDTRLPRFKTTIQEESRRFGFDWRLIAAMAYQESHYRPLATSYTGVRGFMQITRVTAREMGITNRLDPKQSIHAGVKYLRRLYDRFDAVQDDWQRTLLALAAYNVGYGHVRDAQLLAHRRGLDPNSWSSLEETLPLLRIPRHYRTTKHGYARGTEPVRYVNRILTYYDILRRKAVQL
jgi:membrane-bound lytic murein transglycosylase F